MKDVGLVVSVLLFLWAGWQSEKAAMRRRRRLRESWRRNP